MHLVIKTPVGSLLLLALVGAAPGQRAEQVQGRVDRATEASMRVQERATQAQSRAGAVQDRADAAQERAAAVQERAAAAQDRGESANAAAARAQSAGAAGRQVAAKAQDREVSAANQHQQFRSLAEAHPQALELIDRYVAVRGEVVAFDPSVEVLDAARQNGFSILAEETIEGIELRYVTLAVPTGMPLEQALLDLRALAPRAEFAANHIHIRSGTSRGKPVAGARLASSSRFEGPALGLIDGGVAETGHLLQVLQRGFVAGAPAPDEHATSMASLLAGVGRMNSAAPGAPLLVADIYGQDPKGGNSLALARALGWLAQRNVPVAVIGLVGPANPIVARAVRQVQARGMIVVAPVGNAGPAAPPMYPAAYPGVVGATGVDRRNRALVEGGRGAHVDFAAPGADILAADASGKLVKVRGTSFAAPLVAGRLWHARDAAYPLSVLTKEAVDLGPKGRDPVFGNGLVCATCR